MSKPPLFFIIILVVIAVLASRQFIKQRRESALNDASPLRSIQAEVKARREYPASDLHSRQREVIAGEEMRYEVWFHPLNGAEDFKFTLKEAEYRQLNEGERGTLELQGSRFIRFVPARPAAR
ncbi:hypothetical protein BL250_05635 [Erwinia sp. OLTSP20]|uniref:DUF2500 domain-containing protein n=1 Tax=unclassified Erwinia TaxID=2622719 RepID=UPI000C18C976|nr:MULTISPECIES: DUF2500 domain-containing protein [unclassified Erwinia]PIJ51148.1 hypothetical protein BV501_05095 [Erwinia sp. OAMSP11]PIJ73900.1 hypothetical protein BK416_05370 [Erwinia sp. OLSSP12]PIJ83908.1 hypothetical protein BLD47_02995 [Erwinia sp. OLCASP19]PIJ86438.1 hypothetical protein BLD46_03275 [Erwinia sp. OLMTSP26]PIJ87917.1 hypothetical protein BLD49_03955 [Erwinia sp. OLMDSP33]